MARQLLAGKKWTGRARRLAEALPKDFSNALVERILIQQPFPFARGLEEGFVDLLAEQACRAAGITTVEIQNLGLKWDWRFSPERRPAYRQIVQNVFPEFKAAVVDCVGRDPNILEYIQQVQEEALKNQSDCRRIWRCRRHRSGLFGGHYHSFHRSG